MSQTNYILILSVTNRKFIALSLTGEGSIQDRVSGNALYTNTQADTHTVTQIHIFEE